MAKLYIIRGISGSGKSTLARKLIEKREVDLHFEADMFFSLGGRYQFDPSKLKQAHGWCQDRVFSALNRNMHVVVSNTFIKHWEYQPYVDYCKRHGIEYVIIVCRGEYQNVHGVPEAKIQQMRENWQE